MNGRGWQCGRAAPGAVLCRAPSCILLACCCELSAGLRCGECKQRTQITTAAGVAGGAGACYVCASKASQQEISPVDSGDGRGLAVLCTAPRLKVLLRRMC